MNVAMSAQLAKMVLSLLAWYDSCRHGFHQWAARCVPGACGGKLHLFYNYAGTAYVLQTSTLLYCSCARNTPPNL